MRNNDYRIIGRDLERLHFCDIPPGDPPMNHAHAIEVLTIHIGCVPHDCLRKRAAIEIAGCTEPTDGLAEVIRFLLDRTDPSQ
ncbi:hypothetical protein ACFV4K_07335 [Nocardia sp. NPDC059764]|uniref:hypothetical protein n=1 Tax=Nocardia sp. NPDC059764 TaxID=3346939 RepID=UPI003653C215